MSGIQLHTSGVAVLDTLIDGVRVGDNLVVVLTGGAGGDWLVDRYVAAAEDERLIVIDAVGRHAEGSGAQVLDWSRSGAGPEQARAALAEADERVGADAAFVVDSLSALAGAWGDQAALDLFLWACPRLFHRRSIALWLVCADQHDEVFLRRLTAVTQVVVRAGVTDRGWELRVVKADGRSASVLDRSIVAQLVDGDLTDARPIDARPGRVGEWLRELRLRRGVGQADLARRVGISPSALSQAERGVRAISAETLLRVWEVLGFPGGAPGVLERGYRVHRRGGQPDAALAPGARGQRRSADGALTVWEVVLEPRAAGRKPLFAVKATETLLVSRGVVQVELDGVVEVLHEGDTLVADTAAISAWANPADTAAEVLWLLAAR